MISFADNNERRSTYRKLHLVKKEITWGGIAKAVNQISLGDLEVRNSIRGSSRIQNVVAELPESEENVMESAISITEKEGSRRNSAKSAWIIGKKVKK